jgi:hypothetical protein
MQPHQHFATPKAAFSISAPVQLPKIAASTRTQPICLKLSVTALLSLWINRRVIELFCAQVFDIRKGQGIYYSAPPSKIRAIN